MEKQSKRSYYPLFEKTSADLLEDADEAITKCELWDWLKQFTPKENEGFMFCEDENLKKINKEMKLLEHHSGASYAWTMRTMEFVAKEGWDALYEQVMKRETKARKRAEALNEMRRS